MARGPTRQPKGPRGRPPRGRPPPPLAAREEPALAGEPSVRLGVEVVAALWEE
ncbi:MAG TPA: hypothetical protein VNL95_05400 [Dehalococcoidia bacterium]|nr:hypothetical protein [Dehalococcoidia bacterium]